MRQGFEQTRGREVTVRIDESGKKRVSAEIDHAGVMLGSPGFQLLTRADGDDVALLDGQGFDHAVARVQGQDGPTDEQKRRRRPGARENERDG